MLKYFSTEQKEYRKATKCLFRFRTVWFLRQLLPLTYWFIENSCESPYGTPIVKFTICKQWFGRTYRIISFYGY